MTSGLMSGAVSIASTANCERSWNVSFGCDRVTRRVRFLTLKSRRTSIGPPSKT